MTARIVTTAGLSIVLAFASSARPASAQLLLGFSNPDSSTSCENLFGNAAAASAQIVAIGAPRSTVAGKAAAGRVHLYNARTGALLRSLEAPAPGGGHHFGMALAVAGSRVLVGSTVPGATAHLFDGATGALLRSFDASRLAAAPFQQPPALAAQRVAFLGDDVLVTTGGPVLLFDHSTGAVLRTFPADPSGGYTGRLAVASGKLVVASFRSGPQLRGVVRALDPATTAPLWTFVTAGPSLTPEFADVVAGQVVVADPHDGGDSLIVLDATTGVELERFAGTSPIGSSSLHTSLAAAGGAIVATSAGSARLDVIDAGTGRLRNALQNPVRSGPLVSSAGAATFLVAGYPEQETEDPCTGVQLLSGDATCDPATPGVCDPCTTCDPAIGCVPRPRSGCRRSTVRGGSSFLVQDRADDKQDSLTWKWTRGAATGIHEFFGPPEAGKELGLCVYDHAPDAPDLVLAAGIGCGQTDCWKSGAQEFSFASKMGERGGVKSARLQAGAEGRAQIGVTAGGVHLQVPALPLSPGVVVQLHSASGVCWEAGFAAPRDNDANQFRAKSD